MLNHISHRLGIPYDSINSVDALTARIKDSKELLELHKIYEVIKDARKCGQKHCEFWQIEASNIREEQETEWFRRLQIISDNDKTGTISAIADVGISIAKNLITISDDEALHRAVKAMKKLNAEVDAQLKEKNQ